MKEKNNAIIKPEDENLAYTIWRRSRQDSSAIEVLCDMFNTNSREVHRVITDKHIQYMQRIRRNTEANRAIY